ncbi:MAG: flavodoxin family protein [Oscillospiraceae bacterium]|jgi:multimeric flavodoxin WrbA|nr:flavodoxin family protein [Oscillospiraceae bacterium]
MAIKMPIKVLAINGSPNPVGNTAHMLRTVLEPCAAAGFATEFYQAGGRPVRGCVACGGCGRHPGRCAVEDWMNELYPKMAAADAIVLGSPTYFADLTPEIKAVIDRTGFISRKDGMRFSHKIGASVCAVRRAGSIHVLDSINHFFLLSDMVVPGSSYWNMSLALVPGEYEQDEEGVETMQRLGENIVWLAERIAGEG